MGVRELILSDPKPAARTSVVYIACTGIPRMPTVTERDGAFHDVIVVGSGNAGFCAALSARELGARVLLLEKGSEDWIGGNSYFTAGAFRTTFAGLDDLLPLLDGPDPARLALTDVEPYTTADFTADMHRVTEGRCDRTL